MQSNFSMKPIFEAVTRSMKTAGNDYTKPMVAPETRESIRAWGVCQQHIVKANKGVYNLH